MTNEQTQAKTDAHADASSEAAGCRDTLSAACKRPMHEHTGTDDEICVCEPEPRWAALDPDGGPHGGEAPQPGANDVS